LDSNLNENAVTEITNTVTIESIGRPLDFYQIFDTVPQEKSGQSLNTGFNEFSNGSQMNREWKINQSNPPSKSNYFEG